MATNVTICNAALLMVNANTISSFSDETREAAICNSLYETTKDTILMKFPWSFSLFQEQLAQTVNTPLFDYTYEYQLPTGYLRILKKDNLGNDYRILKDKLLTDANAVELLYQKDPGEEFYSPLVVRALEFRMADLLSLALVQDENMSDIYNKRYLVTMAEARATDSQNAPNELINATELSLTAVRGADG
jgi:hypothetical protein